MGLGLRAPAELVTPPGETLLYLVRQGEVVLSLSQPLRGAEAQVSVRFLQELNSATVNLILQVNGLKLERHGEYTIDLAVDGIHQGSLPLYFSPPPQPQPGSGQATV